MAQTQVEGLLVLDKPSGLTSRDVVNRVQTWFPRGLAVGHTGTLDPLASGVLVLCLGRATRLAEYVQRMAKTYQARIQLGVRSDSDDADGHITAVPNAPVPTRASLEACLAPFQGTIDQVPPQFSAAHVAGRRAYDLARGGQTVDLAPRSVVIHAIAIDDYAYPYLDLTVRCGKGTYIRSLARDLGERLGCGGMIAVLRRVQVGPFRAEQGLSLEATPELARARLLPLGAAVQELPRVEPPADLLDLLRHGRSIAWSDLADGADAGVFAADGSLAAIARVTGGVLKPLKVFPPSA